MLLRDPIHWTQLISGESIKVDHDEVFPKDYLLFVYWEYDYE